MAGTGLVALKKEDLRCVLRRPRRPSPTLVPLAWGAKTADERRRDPSAARPRGPTALTGRSQ